MGRVTRGSCTLLSSNRRSLSSCLFALFALFVCADSLSAYHIYTLKPDGGARIHATAITKIARKGLMFGTGTEIYNTNSLNTYPDYPELGYDTPENRAISDATAAEINKLVESAHEDGRKALLWSFEIENPPILVAKHPELSCGPGTGWYQYHDTDKRYPVHGLCVYKPGTREFVQKRFDEIFRKCPDIDGILFSLHESASRPWLGRCEACADKSASDRIADTANLVHECVRAAMRKVRPGKEPVNYAREHGLSYAYAAGEAGKMQEVVDGLERIDRSIPVIVRPGLGDYFEFMILNPLIRNDRLEFPGSQVQGLGERCSRPIVIDGAAATRQLDNPACIPAYSGVPLQRYFRAARCPSLAGWGFTRTHGTGETTALRLNAILIDSALALMADPDLDLREFAAGWYEREMDLKPEAASVVADIIIRAYAIDVLSTCVNGTNFPLGATKDWRLPTGDYRGARGRPDQWDTGWWAVTSRHFGTRTAALWPTDDEEPAVYGFGAERYGFGPEAAFARKTAREKLDYILMEKQLAVMLARANLAQARSLEGAIDAELYRKIADQCELALWFARTRQAQSRAFWTWWFLPEIDPETIGEYYRHYDAVQAEDIPNGLTMSARDIKDDDWENRYYGRKRFEAGVSDFPFPEWNDRGRD